MTGSSEGTPKGVRSWPWTAALALLGIAVVVVVAAWAARLQIAEAALSALLEGQGIETTKIDIVELGLRQVRARNLRIGSDRAVEADEITVTYAPAEVIDGRVDEVAVTGLRLRATVGADGLSLGSLDPLLARGADAGERTGGAALPPITLHNAEIAVSTPIGPVRVGGDARLDPNMDGAMSLGADLTVKATPGSLAGRLDALVGPGGAIDGAFVVQEGRLAVPDASITGLAGKLAVARDAGGTARVSTTLSAATIEAAGAVLEAPEIVADLDNSGLRAHARLIGADGRAALEMRADVDLAATPRTAHLEVTASGGTQAALWQAWALPPITDGRAELSATVGLPPDAMTGNVSARLSAADAAFGDARLGEPVFALDGRLSLEGRALTISDPAPGSALRLTTAELGSGWRIVGPFDIAVLAAGGPLLAIDASDRMAPRLTYDLGLGDATAQLFEGSKRIASVHLPSTRVTGASAPAAGEHKEQIKVKRARIEVPAAGLRIDGLDATMDVSLQGADTAPRATFALTAAETDFRAAFPLDSKERLELTGRTPSLALVGKIEPAQDQIFTSITSSGGYVLLPAQHLRISGLGTKIDYVLAGSGVPAPMGSITIERIAIEDPVPPVVPLAFSGTVGPGKADARGSTPITLEGQLSDARQRLVVDILARHDLAHGTGSGTATGRPMTFRSGGLQPGDLFPVLRKLVGAAEGGARFEGRAAWSNGRIERNAQLAFDDMSLVVSGTPVLGINGIVPYRAPDPVPFGTLTIAAIDPGFPITEGKIRARLTPTMTAEIQEMSWRIADGRVFARDVTIDPLASRHTFTVEAEGIDATRLLADARVTGVDATGSLSGAIPVTIEDGKVTVSEGHFGSVIPGTIRYKREGSLDDLRASRPELAMFVEALENFQYDRAEATIDQQPDGEAVVALHIRGKNPDVLQGQPFELNLNISGNLVEIVDCFLQGYCSAEEIGQMLLQFME